MPKFDYIGNLTEAQAGNLASATLVTSVQNLISITVSTGKTISGAQAVTIEGDANETPIIAVISSEPELSKALIELMAKHGHPVKLGLVHLEEKSPIIGG